MSNLRRITGGPSVGGAEIRRLHKKKHYIATTPVMLLLKQEETVMISATMQAVIDRFIQILCGDFEGNIRSMTMDLDIFLHKDFYPLYEQGMAGMYTDRILGHMMQDDFEDNLRSYILATHTETIRLNSLQIDDFFPMILLVLRQLPEKHLFQS